MLPFGFIFVCLCSMLFFVFGETDFCVKSLCVNATHIACQPKTRTWGSFCPRSPIPTIENLNETQIELVLQMHNHNRNQVAMGLIAKFTTARRMATMHWDAELAHLAALNVRQCKMAHDACHNTHLHKESGQNLAKVTYTGKPQTLEQLLSYSINGWWDERTRANMRVIKQFPEDWKEPSINHFTVMIREENTAVGCSSAKFVLNRRNVFLLACNYATTNLAGQPVYEEGPIAAGCKKGKNLKYLGLCSTQEEYAG